MPRVESRKELLLAFFPRMLVPRALAGGGGQGLTVSACRIQWLPHAAA